MAGLAIAAYVDTKLVATFEERVVEKREAVVTLLPEYQFLNPAVESAQETTK